MMGHTVSFNGAAVSQRRKSRMPTPMSTWSTSFNGAAVSQRRKFVVDEQHHVRLLLLQWGRRLSTAEISTAAFGAPARDSASMGPPSLNGGNTRRT